VLAAAFMAVLLTYPALTLALGSVTYLAVIPFSAYRYLTEERKAAKMDKAAKGHAAEEAAARPDEHVIRLRTKQ
jgi:CDP-diacylglycerol--serine O-phosphatidyltransferase